MNKTEESETTSQIVQNNKEINADQTKRILSNWILSSQEIKSHRYYITKSINFIKHRQKDVSSFDSGNSELVMSKEDGKFEYDLNGRKIVHNQEIEVTSSSTEGLFDDEEDEELKKLQLKKLVMRKKVQKLKLHILRLDMKMPIKCLKSN